MIEKIKKQIELNKDKKAYISGNEAITYQELWEQANHYSRLLKKQGKSPVILYGDNSLIFIVAILSCILAERTYVPVGKCCPLERLKEIIKITDSSVILTKEIIDINTIPVIHQLEELEEYNDEKEYSFHNDIIYIIFTSGSTGKPKGVPINRANLNNFIDWLNQLDPLSTYKNCNVFNQANFSFDLSVADLYYSLTNGHTLYDLEQDIQENYESFFKIFQNIEVAFLTPTYSRLCMLDPDFNEKYMKKLKCIYFCGEVLDQNTVKKLWERFPHLRVINAYGPTEATSAVSGIEITKEMLQEERLPIGIDSNFATDISIVENEIILKGPSVFKGYIGNIVGGYYQENNIDCYKTGDIGYIKDHKLYCKGRVDNQIKFKGYRIELEEIDYHIKTIKGVIDCVTIAKEENDKVKAIKSFVMVNQIDKEEIKKELEKKIPSYMIPKTIQIVEELPITNNKKIDRKALSRL